jgi:uncharacterized protein
MDVTPLISTKNMVIQSYASHGFKVSGALFERPIAVTNFDVFDWPDKAIDDLSVDDFKSMRDKANIDVFLIGCGKTMRFLPPSLQSALKEAGIKAETMDTGAACRSFNVMMSDGRAICAILYPPQ